jgi:hypothetical protein
MQLPLLFVFQVEMVGGKSTSLELATPLAIVLAAVVGAHFAARYAGRNVAKELAAADVRLKRELRHAQVIREKEAARRTLDEATNIVTDAMDALVDYSARIKTREDVARVAANAHEGSDAKAELDQALDALVEEISERADACHAATRKLRPAYVRLQLRFPANHSVTESFAALMQAIRASEVQERGQGGKVREDDELAEAEKARAEVPVCLKAYVAAARTWMEAVVEPAV